MEVNSCELISIQVKILFVRNGNITWVGPFLIFVNAIAMKSGHSTPLRLHTSRLMSVHTPHHCEFGRLTLDIITTVDVSFGIMNEFYGSQSIAYITGVTVFMELKIYFLTLKSSLIFMTSNHCLHHYKILQQHSVVAGAGRDLGGSSALREVGALPGSPRAILCRRP